jgi:hypothetical protein
LDPGDGDGTADWPGAAGLGLSAGFGTAVPFSRPRVVVPGWVPLLVPGPLLPEELLPAEAPPPEPPPPLLPPLLCAIAVPGTTSTAANTAHTNRFMPMFLARIVVRSTKG